MANDGVSAVLQRLLAEAPPGEFSVKPPVRLESDQACPATRSRSWSSGC